MAKKKKKKIKKRRKEKKGKHPGGRPLKFKSEAELKKKIDEYFKSCYETCMVKIKVGRKKKKNGKYKTIYKYKQEEKLLRPLTVTGLAIALDTNRQTLINYEQKEEFFDTIKRAKLICENFVEEYLFTGKNVIGAIFNLKNNYQWKDKSEQDVTSGGFSLREILRKNREKNG